MYGILLYKKGSVIEVVIIYAKETRKIELKILKVLFFLIPHKH